MLCSHPGHDPQQQFPGCVRSRSSGKTLSSRVLSAGDARVLVNRPGTPLTQRERGAGGEGLLTTLGALITISEEVAVRWVGGGILWSASGSR